MGDTPRLFLNIRLKWEELEKPHAKAISVMDRLSLPGLRKALAHSAIRRCQMKSMADPTGSSEKAR